jgi:hypothetical protein
MSGSGGSCPPAVLKGWDEVRTLTFAPDASVTVRFPDENGSITTTCNGRLLTTAAGLSLVHLSCHGPNPIAEAGFAMPAHPTVTGGCLVMPDNAQFERHPGDCSGLSTSSTMTFAPVGPGQ